MCRVVLCRLASKAARASSAAATEVSESSSLRRSVVDVDADCVELEHGHDRTPCCTPAASDCWLGDVDAPCDGQTDAHGPVALKNGGVKKEVKFCLDVSDDDGLKRPLNVYQALPETVLFRVRRCFIFYTLYFIVLHDIFIATDGGHLASLMTC